MRLGEYRIKRLIHSGGMGKVYLCEGNVVLKVPLTPEEIERLYPGNPQHYSLILQRLREEAEVLKKLNHPNIVRLIDHFDLGFPVLVLEYVRGVTLKDYVTRPMTLDEVKPILEKVFDAVEYLHSRGVVHGDLNPRNVMVGDDVKLIDFSTAKVGFSGGYGLAILTRYSAPEQRKGHLIPQSDVYSLAKTIYYCLTSKDPPAGKLKCGIKAIERATEYDPRKRYSSVSEFRDELFGLRKPKRRASIFVMGREYEITKDITTIGKSGDIAIPDKLGYVSRIHCVIVKKDGEFILLDNKSRCGTYVYDGTYKRVDKHTLKDGDLIALCYNRERGPYIVLQFRLFS